MSTAPTPADRSRRVKSLAKAAGFDLVGITTTSVPEFYARYLEAIERGHLADLSYLTDAPHLRKDVRKVWPDTRSVIALAVSYGDPSPSLIDAPPGPDDAWIARYARGRDYHLVLKRMMLRLVRSMVADPLCDQLPTTAHRLFVDTGPVLEKAFAMAAGLGWIGKNTLLIHRGHHPASPPGAPPSKAPRTVGRGSHYFLATILTPLELAPDAPETDHCGTCTRCLDVCPTNAFPAPYQLDARRCISTWTIEVEDPAAHIDPDTIGPHVFGCDLCQDVCPWNRDPPPPHPALAPRPANLKPSLSELASLDDETFTLRFPKSAIRRVTAAHMKTVVSLVREGQRRRGEAPPE